MSLKAKIEAVIYATEEPVTLAQLATLFAPELAEARESRLAVEKAAAQAAEAENAGAESETKADTVLPEVDPESDAVLPSDPEANPEAAVEGVPSQVAPVSEPSFEEEKRAARQRERELRDEARSIVEALIVEYDASDRGMEVREIAGGFRIATRAEYHDAVRAFVKSLKPPMKLSLQALETLAVIAYKQPVTAPEVGDIRGVDSAGVLGSLISRKLVTTAGRKQVIGRPILYKTTKEFLLRFGLKDLNELPSMEEFEKMAGELSDAEQMPLPDGTETAESAVVAEPEEAPSQAPVAIAINAAEDDDNDLPAIHIKAEVTGSELVESGRAEAQAVPEHELPEEGK